MKRILSAALWLSAAAAAQAGDLIPTAPGRPPLRVKLHRVETTIDNQVAITRVIQIFANDSDEDLEAIYVFPTPAEATLIDFAMTINGKVMRGELLEKNRARETYERIVRRAKDPGLLEQIGKNVFRMRVFPVVKRSEQRIELTYVERVTYESGRCTWRYPMRVPGSTAETKTDEMDLSVRLLSEIPIREVRSATHAFDVARASDRDVAARLRRADADLSRDVELTYTLALEKSGFDLVAHRTDGDGHFILLVTPAADARDDAMPKDMTFVFDTSGSMQGDKMKQAKAALRFCVSKLRAGDRFNIVTFSDAVDAFRPTHVAATGENVKAAEQFVERLEALGSTNIQGALLRALAHKPEKGRPHMIVFLTDGLPTAGETDAKAILRRVLAENGDEARIFTFGVGADVNRGLLEDVAEGTRAISSFVSVDIELEGAVSALQRRIVAPVIAGLEIDWGGADVHAVYPKKLLDVYAGVQLMVAGRYGKAGTHRVTLRGSHGGKPIEIAQAVAFPEKREASEAIKYIWGARRVADLLDTIRRNGVNEEIVADVVKLSRAYRVATPYTSFLVLEDEAAYDREGIERTARRLPEMKRPLDMKKAVEDPLYSKGADHEELTRAKGESLDFLSDKPFKGKGAADTIGAGAAGGGRYGARLGGKRTLVTRGGGSVATEDAVLGALRWLARHQSADGSWSAAPACGCWANADERDSSLSLLAFLGAGYTHLSRDTHDGICYGDVVKKSLLRLMERQDPEGCLAPRSDSQYLLAHALGALALSEAYGLTGSNLFRDQAQKAIDFLVAAQNPGEAWGATSRAGRNDAAVTAWAVLALRSALLAGLAVPGESLQNVRAWIDATGDEAIGPVATLARLVIDRKADDERVKRGCERLAKSPPVWDAKRDLGSWHVATLALFDGAPADGWKGWNERMKDAFTKNQGATTSGCKAGSWEPGTREGGRVAATALGALMLEVYYRYAAAVRR